MNRLTRLIFFKYDNEIGCIVATREEINIIIDLGHQLNRKHNKRNLRFWPRNIWLLQHAVGIYSMNGGALLPHLIIGASCPPPPPTPGSTPMHASTVFKMSQAVNKI